MQNTYGRGGKAVALRVSGDRAAFYGCRILSYQDTLLDDTGSHYYSNCYIQGATDFISENKGSITAQHRDLESDETGYIFLGCKITATGPTFLGRPWGSYSRVVYAYSYMASNILSAGWSDWGDNTKQSTAFYAEYKNYGPGANKSKRVAWSKKLSIEEASLFLSKKMIGGRSWIRVSPKLFRLGSQLLKAGSANTPS
ncbi:Putative pectinesterase 11 [Linum perenne]